MMLPHETLRFAQLWSSEHNWAIKPSDLLLFITIHKSKDKVLQQLVEDILEDCNFHTINGLIHERKYAEALKRYEKGN